MTNRYWSPPIAISGREPETVRSVAVRIWILGQENAAGLPLFGGQRIPSQVSLDPGIAQAGQATLHYGAYRFTGLAGDEGQQVWVEYTHMLQEMGKPVRIIHNEDVVGINLLAMPYQGQQVDMYERTVPQQSDDPAPDWPEHITMFEQQFLRNTIFRDHSGWFHAIYTRGAAPSGLSYRPY